MNWKVLVGVIWALYVSVTSTEVQVVRSTATNILNGLSFARDIGDFIEDKDFGNVIGKLATGLTPYLGIVGPFVTFILGFITRSESAELKAIKRLHKEVDNRFDKVDLQFNEVKRLIDWSKIGIQYSDIEHKINAINKLYEHIYNIPNAAVRIATSEFVANYDSDYQNSGSKLYNGIMNEERMFGVDLFTAVAKYTENHRANSRTFMLGLLQLLMKAAKLELAYHQLKGHNAAIDFYQTLWQTRFTAIGKKMMSIDSAFVSQYRTQSEKDIDNYLKKHPKNEMNNFDFSNAMYAFLAEKYPWRDWFIVTYKDVSGWDNHAVQACNGHIKFRNRGRNMVVSSVDVRKKHINHYQAQTMVNDVYSCTTGSIGYLGVSQTYKVAIECKRAYATFPTTARRYCEPYAANGVIRYTHGNGNDVHFKAAPRRLVLKSEEECNFVFAFG